MFWIFNLIGKIFLFLLIIVNILFAHIKTYQADFLQIITNPSGKIIKYDGTVKIKQPNKMLWSYKQPVEKYVYMNDTNIIIDEPMLEQAIYTTINDEINLIDFLNEPSLVDDKYKLTFNDNNLTAIHYKDEMDNFIEIKFMNIKINDKIPDQIFHFIAPLDYDIIKK